MRLLQLNIWQGKLLLQTLDLIDKLKPDLLCLQEVFSCETPVGMPDRIFQNLEFIRQQIPHEYVYFSPTFTGIYAGQQASFGNAIISRYPLKEMKTVFISGAYQPHYDTETFEMNTRNLQIVSVEPETGTKFKLANHHGYWLTQPLGDEVTVKKMKLVKEELQKAGQPLIFSGDLNVIPESPSLRVFDNFLTDLTATHEIRTTLSEVGKAKDVPCDHIFISPGITVQSYEVRPELVSDHRAICMDFTVEAL
jgi:endonuclease/exonuclease/phosphatase family metal-dependent hydrolase